MQWLALLHGNEALATVRNGCMMLERLFTGTTELESERGGVGFPWLNPFGILSFCHLRLLALLCATSTVDLCEGT